MPSNTAGNSGHIRDGRFGLLNLVSLALSVYILAAISIDTFVALPHKTSKLLDHIIAIALMTVGVGIFGTFTAFVASWFVTHDKQ